jgi:hypothetical protein
MTKGHGWTLPRALLARDHGAVAVEFALLFPVQLMMFAGIFGMGAVMIEDMQLNFVVEGAAKLEAGAPPPGTGAGVTWASAQLPPPASFVANPTASCAQIVGRWPISLGVFPTLTLSAWACSPWPTKPPP